MSELGKAVGGAVYEKHETANNGRTGREKEKKERIKTKKKKKKKKNKLYAGLEDGVEGFLPGSSSRDGSEDDDGSFANNVDRDQYIAARLGSPEPQSRIDEEPTTTPVVVKSHSSAVLTASESDNEDEAVEEMIVEASKGYGRMFMVTLCGTLDDMLVFTALVSGSSGSKEITVLSLLLGGSLAAITILAVSLPLSRIPVFERFIKKVPMWTLMFAISIYVLILGMLE